MLKRVISLKSTTFKESKASFMRHFITTPAVTTTLAAPCCMP